VGSRQQTKKSTLLQAKNKQTVFMLSKNVPFLSGYSVIATLHPHLAG
jgi:hypothetical protein